MALLSGRRKRRNDINLQNQTGSASETSQTGEFDQLFRQHFEAQFNPLEISRRRQGESTPEAVLHISDEAESDWEGLSDGDRDEPPIVHHLQSDYTTVDVPNGDFKGFMVHSALSQSLSRHYTMR